MDSISAPLKGKVAIVTGGSRGIGASIARTFARQGCTHIAITYTSQKGKAEDVLRSISEVNSKIKTCAIAADLEDADIGSKVITQALKSLAVDHIDILVSNAAVVDQASMPPVADMTKALFDKMITANAWAPLALAQSTIQHMPRGGRLIFISSGASRYPGGDPFISYSASKAALDTISRNLAVAWGIKYGVTVNSISVGPTATDATKEAVEKGGPAFEEMISNVTLLKRIAEPQEVADVVAFVASPGASWITGNQIPANGGALSALQS